MLFRLLVFSLLVLLCNIKPLHLSAQGIRGTVKTSAGENLPYASIFIPGLNIGASTNINGEYEVKLPAGKHIIAAQYVGYEKIELQIEIVDKWINHDFILKDVMLLLNEVTIRSRREDPSYTIIRKAIAKRKYHLLQYDSYDVKVYIKGTGELQKVPFFLKKTIEKEGDIKLNEAYTSESVSQVHFQQPDNIEEKVISVYTSGNDSGSPGPSIFIHQRIYQEKVAGIVSPLAPSAFSYYKFRYEGSFREGDIEVNKIKVTPRSWGEQVFEGYIYIIDGLWAVHSLDLETILMGFKIDVKQNFAEVAPTVWMPVTHEYLISGKVWGFAGEYRYLASLSDYSVELNPELAYETEILDEKIQDIPEDIAKIVPKRTSNISEVLANEDQLTRKQFNKVITQYEKESLQQREAPEVVSEWSYSVDSMAYKRDSLYWEMIRPVPLTPKEMRGYYRDDSIAHVEISKTTGQNTDTRNKRKKRKLANLSDVFLGGNYRLSPKINFALDPMLPQVYFNTVEGLNVNMSGSLSYNFDSARQSLTFSPVLRYGFSSEDFYAMGKLSHRTKGKPRTIFLEGGSFVEQFNANNPIHPHINTASTLVFRRNFMKIYEKNYAKAGYSYEPSVWFSLNSSIEWAQRKELYNQNDYSFFYKDSRNFSSNRPNNIEIPDAAFPIHNALVFSIDISYKPQSRYKINNGRKVPLTERSPELLFLYRKGISKLLDSDVDFDHIELGIDHEFSFGIRGELQFELRGGAFLNNNSLYLMDYKHFDGNRTILSALKPAGSFRLLDYYAFSTVDPYFSAHTHFQFRKFLLTQLPLLRFSGIKENIFVNYLKTTYSPHYYEIGYSIDQVFRLFRIEIATSFIDDSYKEFGLRIGIATKIFGMKL